MKENILSLSKCDVKTVQRYNVEWGKLFYHGMSGVSNYLTSLHLDCKIFEVWSILYEIELAELVQDVPSSRWK